MTKFNIKPILKTLLASAFAYVVTCGVIGGFDEAHAGARQVPSSDCHSATPNASIDNSGVLTNTGAANVAIYCPLVADSIISRSNATTMNVYGNEGANGSNSKACMCLLNPIACSCSPNRDWTNNAGGIAGRVAPSVSTQVWVTAPEEKFAYMLHVLTTNSSLAGTWLNTP